MTKEEVLQEFGKGFDCGQVVFSYWAKELGLDEQTAKKISTGFGGGMMQGETCGAVIGACMAMGLKYGISTDGEEGQNQKVTSVIKAAEFREKFLEKYSSTMCRELLEADISTPEGMKSIGERQLMTTFCPQLVVDVIEILEKIM